MGSVRGNTVGRLGEACGFDKRLGSGDSMRCNRGAASPPAAGKLRPLQREESWRVGKCSEMDLLGMEKRGTAGEL